jgi:hypothetical protein
VLDLGLDKARQAALLSTFTAPTYRMTPIIEVLDFARNVLADISDMMIEGQVDVDADADISRSLTLTLADKSGTLPFNTESPASTALYYDRAIRASARVIVPDYLSPDGIAFPVTIPVFTGPVTKMERTGATVMVECQGFEYLYCGAVWNPVTYAAGTRKPDVIRGLLASGNPVYRPATHLLDIPPNGNTIPAPLQLVREDSIWPVVTQLAGGMSLRLWWDGSGVCRMAPSQTLPVWLFRDVSGPDGDDVQITYSDTVTNCAYVIGGTPEGAQGPVTATAVAPANHPLSPQKVGRYRLPDGQPYTDDTLMSKAACQGKADTLMAANLIQNVSAAFTAVPMWLLDPRDTCRVETQLGAITFPIRKYTLPLGGGGGMSVGFNQAVQYDKVVRKIA